MSLVIVLSAVVGAGLFFAGGCAGYWLEHRQAVRAPAKKVRKPRVPKCYVIIPENGMEPRHKRQKKTSRSGHGTPGEVDLEKIPGIDTRV